RVVLIFEGRGGAIEHGVVEVPLRRCDLPDQLVELAPVLAVTEAAALSGKVVLIPPAQLRLRRQRLLVCLEVDDQVAAHRHQPGTTFVAVAGTELTFGLWWMYFTVPSAEGLHGHPERLFPRG